MTDRNPPDFPAEEYLSKILGFCYQKVNSKEDAEDLAQEITLEVLKAMRGGKQIENLNAFIWSVTNHTFCKWLRAKKHGSTSYLTELFASPENIEEDYLQKEQRQLLRREIALLSEKYRECVLLHYFDGISCGEIARRLGKSAGTVKWWLYDARRFIREGMSTMRKYGEKSFRPGTLNLSCQGRPGLDCEPMSCVKRKSTQNILLAAYPQALTIEDLCTELGISAPYIEDEVNSLLENQLMKPMGNGTYQTDFVILPGDNCKLGADIYEACFPEYYQNLMAVLEENKDVLCSGRYNTAGFSWERLLWVYIHIITDFILCKYKREECAIAAADRIPVRPNGGCWIALGFENKFIFETGKTQDRKAYHLYDGPVHKSGTDCVQGFFHYWSGIDSSVFFEIPDGVFALCRDVIRGAIKTEHFTEEQKYHFGIAIEKNLFLKTERGFRQNYYFAGRSERVKIEEIAFSFYQEAKKSFQKAYGLIRAEYLPGIPKHLHWQMGNFMTNYLNLFVTCSLYEGWNEGKLSPPDPQNKEWLSLFATEI